MPASSFVKRHLRVTLQLSNNAVFAGTGNNTLKLEGLRVVANINSAGAPVAPAASLRIYGMLQSDMNALTQLQWVPTGIQRNTVTVEADNGNGYVSIFQGQIVTAGPDYTGAPDVCLNIEAVTLYWERINPAPPTSYTGATSVATIVQTLATAMGKQFENNGVTAQVTAPYLPTTLAEQLVKICHDAGVDLYIDQDTVAICPTGTPRSLQSAVLNPGSGLIGYPTLDNVGLQVKAIFDPSFRFGGPITISGSDIPAANGNFRIYTLQHSLESEKPDGVWLSQLGVCVVGAIVGGQS